MAINLILNSKIYAKNYIKIEEYSKYYVKDLSYCEIRKQKPIVICRVIEESISGEHLIQAYNQCIHSSIIVVIQTSDSVMGLQKEDKHSKQMLFEF